MTLQEEADAGVELGQVGVLEQGRRQEFLGFVRSPERYQGLSPAVERRQMLRIEG